MIFAIASLILSITTVNISLKTIILFSIFSLFMASIKCWRFLMRPYQFVYILHQTRNGPLDMEGESNRANCPDLYQSFAKDVHTVSPGNLLNVSDFLSQRLFFRFDFSLLAILRT